MLLLNFFMKKKKNCSHVKHYPQNRTTLLVHLRWFSNSNYFFFNSPTLSNSLKLLSPTSLLQISLQTTTTIDRFEVSSLTFFYLEENLSILNWFWATSNSFYFPKGHIHQVRFLNSNSDFFFFFFCLSNFFFLRKIFQF